jgi:hypothetical protein
MKAFNIIKISLKRGVIVEIINFIDDNCHKIQKLSTRKRLRAYENVCVNIYLHNFVSLGSKVSFY